MTRNYLLPSEAQVPYILTYAGMNSIMFIYIKFTELPSRKIRHFEECFGLTDSCRCPRKSRLAPHIFIEDVHKFHVFPRISHIHFIETLLHT